MLRFVIALLLASASAFVPASRPAALELSRHRVARPSITMAGWNDPYDVRNMDKTVRVSKGKTANTGSKEFTEYMDRTNQQAEVWNLAGAAFCLITVGIVLIKIG